MALIGRVITILFLLILCSCDPPNSDIIRNYVEKLAVKEGHRIQAASIIEDYKKINDGYLYVVLVNTESPYLACVRFVGGSLVRTYTIGYDKNYLPETMMQNAKSELL